MNNNGDFHDPDYPKEFIVIRKGVMFILHDAPECVFEGHKLISLKTSSDSLALQEPDPPARFLV